jgi:hypothetical protein
MLLAGRLARRPVRGTPFVASRPLHGKPFVASRPLQKEIKGYDLYKAYQQGKVKPDSTRAKAKAKATVGAAPRVGDRPGGRASTAAAARAKGAPPAKGAEKMSPTKKGLMWFFGGILLRAPAVLLMRAVAQALVTGPLPVKMLGGFILFVLGATATSEGQSDDPFGPNGDPANQAPAPANQLPPKVQREREREIPVQKLWKNKSLTDVRLHLVPVPHDDPNQPKFDRWWGNGRGKIPLHELFEQAFWETSHSNCVGRDGKSKMKSAKILRIERVENMRLWKQYWHRKRELTDTHKANRVRVQLIPPTGPAAKSMGPGSALDVDGLLDKGLNEHFFFHGTRRDIANLIVQHGFDERVASLGGLYGAGCYHASQACKAGQYADTAYLQKGPEPGGYPPGYNGYTKVKTILVSRVLLGDPQVTNRSMNNMRRPNEKITGSGILYDSVVATGGNQVHDEYIVYDRTQVYPEYILTVCES